MQKYLMILHYYNINIHSICPVGGRIFFSILFSRRQLAGVEMKYDFLCPL